MLCSLPLVEDENLSKVGAARDWSLNKSSTGWRHLHLHSGLFLRTEQCAGDRQDLGAGGTSLGALQRGWDYSNPLCDCRHLICDLKAGPQWFSPERASQMGENVQHETSKCSKGAQRGLHL